MKTLKFISIFCLLLVMNGCTSKPPKWMIEQEEKNKLNNKLTISNFVVGKSPIVIENVKDFYSSSHGFIYYQKDGIKYEYRGNYLFEFEINK